MRRRYRGDPLRPLLVDLVLFARQCDDKDFRGPSWRRQFPPRDIHGISMMPGSAETLPAGFRLTATSGHSRRLPPEGKGPHPCAHAPTLARGFQTATPVCRSLRAAQSCTRRRTTVPMTRIRIGFKVSPAPPPKVVPPPVPCVSSSSFSANGPPTGSEGGVDPVCGPRVNLTAAGRCLFMKEIRKPRTGSSMGLSAVADHVVCDCCSLTVDPWPQSQGRDPWCVTRLMTLGGAQKRYRERC